MGLRAMCMVGVLLAFLVTTVGCASMSPAQEGAVGGAAVGALAGQIIGKDTGGTLIGAGVGALGGALLNDHMAREKERAYEQGVQDASR